MAVIGRVLEAQGFASASSPSRLEPAEPFGRSGAEPVLRRDRREHGFDDQPLHRGPKIRSDDAYTPGDGRQAARPRALVYAQRCRRPSTTCPSWSAASRASLRRIAHYDYWRDKVRRSILVDSKADLLLLRQRRARIVEIAHRLARASRSLITDVRGTAFVRRSDDPERRGLVRGSTRARSTARPHRRTSTPYRPPAKPAGLAGCELRQGRRCTAVVRASRGHRRARAAAARAHTVIRLPAYEQVKSRPGAVRPRQPRAAPGDQPGNARALVQRMATAATRRLDQPAAHPAEHGGDGPRLRPALCAQPAPALRRRERQPDGADQDPGLGDDPLQRQHHARLLRRLHLLLDHRARGPHHPEPQRRLGDPRDRGDPRQGQGLHRRHQRPRRADGQHVPPRLQEPRDRGRLPQAELRLPGICQNLGTDHARWGCTAAGAAGRQEGPDRLGPALRPRGAIARVREGTGRPPRRRLSEDRARAHRGRPAHRR